MLGPIVFVAAWSALGAAAEGYDPTRQAISRLAQLGAATRPAMTAALVVLGAGMVLYGVALPPTRSWALPVANGLTAFAVAALPLGGAVDTAHGAAAAAGYVTLAAIPVVLGGGPSRLVGLACAACLLASVLVARDGLFQRLGLTIGHLWVVFSAASLLRSPRSSSTAPPAPAP
ncbi:MAG TPA: DUF998 domain-containing protein [Acidimicrobiales bacterium]|nr:DUF998 domain-containing protein [Acidimicrobiales bacterium]